MNKNDDSNGDKELIEMANKILNEASSTNGEPNTQLGNAPYMTSKTTELTEEQKERYIKHARLSDKKLYYEPSKWIFEFNNVHDVKYVYKTDSVIRAGHRLEMKSYLAFVREQSQRSWQIRFLRSLAMENSASSLAFEDTALLSDRDLMMLLQNVDNETLLRACKNCDKLIIERVLNQFTPLGRKYFVDDFAKIGNVDMKEIIGARNRIGRILTEMYLNGVLKDWALGYAN